MADPAATTTVKGVQVPADIQKKHKELVELILGSESMHDEERQYWINILPIMTPDQLKNLGSILVREKEQLATIDKKYSTEIKQIGEQELVRRTEEQRRARRNARTEAESKIQLTEDEQEEDVLRKIDEA